MTQKNVEDIIKKILQSHEFQGSDTYQRLLRYLAEKSLSGESPKESTIAFDVFDKDITSDNIDSSSVRVYVHNLRQKLNSYYLNEGKDEEVRLKIPKGHYQVKFETTAKNTKSDHAKFLVLTNIISLVIIMIAIFYIALNYRQITAIRDEPFTASIIWNEYLNSDKPVLLVFGDYYLYEDRALPTARYVRDFRVNSPEDFQEFLLQEPRFKDVYKATTHTLLGKFALTCLNDLSAFFSKHDKKVDLVLGSALQWEDLNRKNVIFVGSFKTLRILKNLVNDHHFKYLIHPNTLSFTNTDNDTTYSYQAPKDHGTGQVKDYAIFSRFRGPNQNVITIFSSTHDVGHISTVRHFTTPETTEDFEKNYLQARHQNVFFDALFEVQGFDRTGFQPKLLHLSWLDFDPDLPQTRK